jgi:hypothetical protein
VVLIRRNYVGMLGDKSETIPRRIILYELRRNDVFLLVLGPRPTWFGFSVQ